jgi:hypothetical protein
MTEPPRMVPVLIAFPALGASASATPPSYGGALSTLNSFSNASTSFAERRINLSDARRHGGRGAAIVELSP